MKSRQFMSVDENGRSYDIKSNLVVNKIKDDARQSTRGYKLNLDKPCTYNLKKKIKP